MTTAKRGRGRPPKSASTGTAGQAGKNAKAPRAAAPLDEFQQLLMTMPDHLLRSFVEDAAKKLPDLKTKLVLYAQKAEGSTSIAGYIELIQRQYDEIVAKNKGMTEKQADKLRALLEELLRNARKEMQKADYEHAFNILTAIETFAEKKDIATATYAYYWNSAVRNAGKLLSALAGLTLPGGVRQQLYSRAMHLITRDLKLAQRGGEKTTRWGYDYYYDYDADLVQAYTDAQKTGTPEQLAELNETMHQRMLAARDKISAGKRRNDLSELEMALLKTLHRQLLKKTSAADAARALHVYSPILEVDYIRASALWETGAYDEAWNLITEVLDQHKDDRSRDSTIGRMRSLKVQMEPIITANPKTREKRSMEKLANLQNFWQGYHVLKYHTPAPEWPAMLQQIQNALLANITALKTSQRRGWGYDFTWDGESWDRILIAVYVKNELWQQAHEQLKKDTTGQYIFRFAHLFPTAWAGKVIRLCSEIFMLQAETATNRQGYEELAATLRYIAALHGGPAEARNIYQACADTFPRRKVMLQILGAAAGTQTDGSELDILD